MNEYRTHEYVEEAEGGALLASPFSSIRRGEMFETIACAYVRFHSTSKTASVPLADYTAAAFMYTERSLRQLRLYLNSFRIP